MIYPIIEYVKLRLRWLMDVKHISGFMIETADMALGSEDILVTLEGADGYEDDLVRISSEQGMWFTQLMF